MTFCGNSTVGVGDETVSQIGGKSAAKTNEEIVRLILQYLKDNGYVRTMETLTMESGYQLEHPNVSSFVEHVKQGEWNEAVDGLEPIKQLLPDDRASQLLEAKFLLLEQKYLELLDEDKRMEALEVLRNELTPMAYKTVRVHQMTAFLMYADRNELHQRAKWLGKSTLSRLLALEHVKPLLQPDLLLPTRRLQGLLRQAIELQTRHCACHDMAWQTDMGGISLLSDHRCMTDRFPLETVQILTGHRDEVWCCQFSPDGRKFASGSKDGTIMIWHLDEQHMLLKRHIVIEVCCDLSVAFLDWSPDSKLLLVGGPEGTPYVTIWSAEDGKLLLEMAHSIGDSLSCGVFNRDGSRFICGGKKGQFYVCDLNGTVRNTFDGVRVTSVAVRADNNSVLAADNYHRIRSYSLTAASTVTDILRETHPIMSFSISSNDRLALLNVSNQGLHLWDLHDCCIVRRFSGASVRNFTIHSCFGGINENFIASGSEDKFVYIWNIKCEKPLAKLPGHMGIVNCVHWNPVYPTLLASASDDATVRIWGLRHVKAAESG